MKEVAWWEHSPARQRNEELLGRHAVLIEKVSNAVTYCANRINELQLGTLEESYTAVTADQIPGGALDFLVPGGGRLVEGASTVFNKRLSASGSRTNVLDEVDLTETAPPAVP